MEFTITSDDILWICGFLGAIWGVVKIVKEIRKPQDDLRKQVQENTKQIKDDEVRIHLIEEKDRLILQSLLVIINHDITGNGIEQLKDARNDIQEFLINK